MSKLLKTCNKIYNTRYFNKIADLIEDLNEKEYHSLLGPNVTPIPYYSDGHIEKGIIKYKTIQVMSNLQIAKLERNIIVDTLRNTNFKRESKWNKYSTIGFIEEMIRYNYKRNIPTYGEPNETRTMDQDLEDYLNEISERYSIPKSKLKSTMSIMLINIKKGNDQYNLLDYFDWYELFQYKYENNKEQLIKDFEEGKLYKEEEKIYRQISGVE